MIQRMQTLYLLFIIILCLLLLNGSILNFADASATSVKLSAVGRLYDQDQKLIAQVAPVWMITVLLGVICVISAVDILLYRKRRLQMSLTMSLIVISALLAGVVVWLGFSVIRDFRMTFTPGLKMSFPLLIMIFSILAFVGIRKDELLVKSYDRLR